MGQIEADVEGIAVITAALTKQGRAEDTRTDLDALTSPKDYPMDPGSIQRREELARQVATDSAPKWTWHQVKLTAKSVRAEIKKSRGKAAGPDQWRADIWDDFPDDAY